MFRPIRIVHHSVTISPAAELLMMWTGAMMDHNLHFCLLRVIINRKNSGSLIQRPVKCVKYLKKLWPHNSNQDRERSTGNFFQRPMRSFGIQKEIIGDIFIYMMQQQV